MEHTQLVSLALSNNISYQDCAVLNESKQKGIVVPASRGIQLFPCKIVLYIPKSCVMSTIHPALGVATFLYSLSSLQIFQEIVFQHKGAVVIKNIANIAQKNLFTFKLNGECGEGTWRFHIFTN